MTQIAPSAAPVPQWQGLKLGEVRLHDASTSWPVPFEAKAAAGRPEGYSSLANATRAARLLSRGDDRAAVAITADGSAFRVWALSLNDKHSYGHGRVYGFKFERGLPTSVGHGVRLEADASAKVRAGVAAVIDGRATLPIA